jgi:hypothetical protein
MTAPGSAVIDVEHSRSRPEGQLRDALEKAAIEIHRKECGELHSERCRDALTYLGGADFLHRAIISGFCR